MLSFASFLSFHSHYSLAFITQFPLVEWQKTLSVWGRCFPTKIVSDSWLDDPFVKCVAKELGGGDGSTGLAE